tara:strand:+ start:49 stop:672 length:624 start_codon:yes stop_codon:yes gene_type:complete
MAFYIFPRAIPKEKCEEMLASCLQNAKWEDATIFDGVLRDSNETITGEIEPAKPNSTSDHKIRKTDVSFVTDKDNMVNEVVWDYIRHANKIFFKYNLDHFQAVQFARYQNGGHYDWHQDYNYTEGATECRKLSLTMSLTDETTYEGGELEFYNGGKPYRQGKNNVLSDVRAQGSVIVFDSYDWHRVTPVTKGIRYSLVCWTVGPCFI